MDLNGALGAQIRLLFIDAYDSFSNNIIALLTELDCHVTTIRIDQTLPDLDFDAIVIGPGPGHPAKPKDVGLIPQLWTALKARPIPTLGICLGFQTLGITFGAKVQRLHRPRHGIVDEIEHFGDHFYHGAGRITVTSYHSLCVVDLPPALVPLAYIQDPVNGRLIMAMKHQTLPFWGMQYHPESVCSNGGNSDILKKWVKACKPCRSNRRSTNGGSLNPKSFSIGEKSLAFGLDGLLPPSTAVRWKVHIGTPDLSSLVDHDAILLESQTKKGYSIVGFATTMAEYNGFLTIGTHILPCSVRNAWNVLGKLAKNEDKGSGPPTPFWGGWMGYSTYEAGLRSIGIPADAHMKFAWVQRSIVIDHEKHITYVQSIRPNDDWIHKFELPLPEYNKPMPVHGTASLPCETSYRSKVLACQDRLNAGDSYELCLTEQSFVSSSAPPIDIYRSLRKVNPAPFGAFLKLGQTVLLSSSPERFLKWTRDGQCSLRPIKGTVKKSSMSFEAALEVLNSTKERAENLMIVDLIRHDLHGVCKDVAVPSLMQVEEYETVYQLVSEITGTGCGVDVLSAALPPGSMTGAPKLRSCEILQDLEGAPRGVYSGVCGYIDIGGGGDFSVVIRSIFSEDFQPGKNTWRIGAGGAVTALSNDKAEYEEMRTKLDSTLRAFILEDGEAVSGRHV